MKEEQKIIIDSIRQLSIKHDDRLLALSTGALALSITFKNSFVTQDAVSLWILGTSWICFVATILLFFGNRTIQVVLLQELNKFLDSHDEITSKKEIEKFTNIPLSIQICFFTEMLLFIAGIIFLTIFAWLNL